MNKKQSRPEVGIAAKLIKRVIGYMLHYYKIPFLFVIACILITAIATLCRRRLRLLPYITPSPSCSQTIFIVEWWYKKVKYYFFVIIIRISYIFLEVSYGF